jgi:hypothetical protein
MVYDMVRQSSRRSSKAKKSHSDQVPWLPIDSRLIPDIFAFGHVRGVARIFLMLEMILTTFVVLATLVLVVINAVS